MSQKVQVAFWKTRGGKYWLKLFEEPKADPRFTYVTPDGGGAVRGWFLEDVLRHVQDNIMAHWPSKGIRQY